jgi:hypothetical protein
MSEGFGLTTTADRSQGMAKIQERKTGERETLRRKTLREIPSWYRPYFHLAAPSLFGLGIILAAIFLIKDLQGWELLTVPLTYILSNALEWHAHRDLLHTRNRFAKVLYDRHTPLHHQIYVTEDMAYRDLREFRLILLPAYAILLVFFITSPIAVLLWWLTTPNVVYLFVATAVGYVVGYEWLHLSYHLPKNHPIARLRLIRILKRHHATHHDPAVMQEWNLNVSIPLWDWVRGTVLKGSSASR